MNRNRIITDAWSNPDSESLYRRGWPDQPELAEQYESGDQCGGCAFYAKLNADFGICCRHVSPYFTETVFEHFTCAAFVLEDWDFHSFAEPKTYQFAGITEQR